MKSSRKTSAGEAAVDSGAVACGISTSFSASGDAAGVGANATGDATAAEGITLYEAGAFAGFIPSVGGGGGAGAPDEAAGAGVGRAAGVAVFREDGGAVAGLRLSVGGGGGGGAPCDRAARLAASTNNDARSAAAHERRRLKRSFIRPSVSCRPAPPPGA